MSPKCVHKGCGIVFTDPEEECLYHPGPPVFHEGQKGWTCCKPRVLTFDEFLSIKPCTKGKHSTVNDTPAPAPPKPSTTPESTAPPSEPKSTENDKPGIAVHPRIAQAPQAAQPPAPPSATPESDSDDPSLPVPPNTTCRRRGCNTTSPSNGPLSSARDGEKCVYHPGQALFHEGTKGWTCCKRRVLEFDEFMRIEGCVQKRRHLFVGSGKTGGNEEVLQEIKHDFYQTPTVVIASFYLKKINKERAKIDFSSPTTVALDLPTTDSRRYHEEVPLFGQIDTVKSNYKIMGTKLELTLAKKDGSSWPTLRSDEQRTSEIIQVGPAGRA